MENDDICRLNEDRDRIEDMNILDDPDSIVSLMGFEWIKPMDDMQFPFVFTPEDLDSEGRIHVTGKATDDAVLEVYANGEYVSLDDPMVHLHGRGFWYYQQHHLPPVLSAGADNA